MISLYPKWRDPHNAIALGMVVGNLLARFSDKEDESYPERWRDIGWDQIVCDVEHAAKALDIRQHYAYLDNQEDTFWDEHDWYLTLDKIGEEIWKDPGAQWSQDKLNQCLVKQ